MLADTHAFAIVAAGSGNRRTAAAFRRHHLSLDTSWKDARARIPQLLDGLTTAARSRGEGTIVERATQVDTSLTRAAEEADAERLSCLRIG